MNTKKNDKSLTKDQAEKKLMTLKKDLFNIRFKKINGQINTRDIFKKLLDCLLILIRINKLNKKIDAIDMYFKIEPLSPKK